MFSAVIRSLFGYTPTPGDWCTLDDMGGRDCQDCTVIMVRGGIVYYFIRGNVKDSRKLPIKSFRFCYRLKYRSEW